MEKCEHCQATLKYKLKADKKLCKLCRYAHLTMEDREDNLEEIKLQVCRSCQGEFLAPAKRYCSLCRYVDNMKKSTLKCTLCERNRKHKVPEICDRCILKHNKRTKSKVKTYKDYVRETVMRDPSKLKYQIYSAKDLLNDNPKPSQDPLDTI